MKGAVSNVTKKKVSKEESSNNVLANNIKIEIRSTFYQSHLNQFFKIILVSMKVYKLKQQFSKFQAFDKISYQLPQTVVTRMYHIFPEKLFVQFKLFVTLLFNSNFCYLVVFFAIHLMGFPHHVLFSIFLQTVSHGFP